MGVFGTRALEVNKRRAASRHKAVDFTTVESNHTFEDQFDQDTVLTEPVQKGWACGDREMLAGDNLVAGKGKTVPAEGLPEPGGQRYRTDPKETGRENG